MSNYLFVLGSPAQIDRAAAWLQRFSADHASELARLQINAHTEALYVAPDAAGDLGANSVFKGYAIDLQGRQLIYGAPGFAAWAGAGESRSLAAEPIEGCYFCVEWNDRVVRVGHDAFGQCALLYFDNDGLVAASDSMFVLTELRKGLGLPCRLNVPACVARSWDNIMASVPMSEATTIEGVRYGGLGTSLEIRLTPSPALNVRRNPAHETFAAHAPSYRDAIREGAQQVAALIRTFAAEGPNVTRVAVSGGSDSRVLLAAALRSPEGRENVIFNSNPAYEEYALVEKLSERFAFPLGRREGPRLRGTSRKVNEDIGLWWLANAGLYDHFYLPRQIATAGANGFDLGGHGGELYKGNYGWRRIQAIARLFKNEQLKAAFVEQTVAGLEAMQVPADTPQSSEWHFLGYRNALHAGRSTIMSMIAVRPLQLRALVGASRSPDNPMPTPRQQALGMVGDLIAVLHPELAWAPYDDERKNLTAEHVQGRVQALGGTLAESDVDLFRFAGDYRTVVCGYPETFMAIARARGFAVALDRPQLYEFARAGLERVTDSTLREIYVPMLEAIAEDLPNADVPFSAMRMRPAKCVSFLLADG